MNNKTNNSDNIYDYLIIGGLSGLNCAYELKKNGDNSFLLLEARNRLGGRTENLNIGDNKSIELGGQWIGESNPNLNKLIGELNIKTYKQYYNGKTILVYDSKNYKEIDEETFSIDDLEINNLNLIFNELKKLLNKINFIQINDPKNDSQLIKELDSISVNEWLLSSSNKKYINDNILKFFNWITKISNATDSKDISFLFFMKYINSIGCIYDVFASNGKTAEYERVIGGTQLISNKIGEYIGKSNYLLNRRVSKIDQNQNNKIITVKTTTNNIYYCKYLIITIPPLLINNISFKPKLPNKKNQYFKTIQHGNVIKVIFIYKNAFWREKGYSGKIIDLSSNSPIKEAYDNCSHDNEINSIVGFICGKQDVLYWSSKSISERKNAIITHLSKYWGEESLYPTHYEEKNWCLDENAGGGCFASYCSPDLNYTNNNLEYLKSFGNIYFAGTETSNKYYGHMEGAINSSINILNQIKKI